MSRSLISEYRDRLRLLNRYVSLVRTHPCLPTRNQPTILNYRP